jgi:hypothetical protein
MSVPTSALNVNSPTDTQDGPASASDASSLTGPHGVRDHWERTERKHVAVDHRSFRAQLLFSIGFAVNRSRDLLRRLLKEHVSDDASQTLATRVLEHLELSGFEIDESDRGSGRRPRNHG